MAILDTTDYRETAERWTEKDRNTVLGWRSRTRWRVRVEWNIDDADPGGVPYGAATPPGTWPHPDGSSPALDLVNVTPMLPHGEMSGKVVAVYEDAEEDVAWS